MALLPLLVVAMEKKRKITMLSRGYFPSADFLTVRSQSLSLGKYRYTECFRRKVNVPSFPAQGTVPHWLSKLDLLKLPKRPNHGPMAIALGSSFNRGAILAPLYLFEVFRLRGEINFAMAMWESVARDRRIAMMMSMLLFLALALLLSNTTQSTSGCALRPVNEFLLQSTALGERSTPATGRRALIIVDMQNDFCLGGPLAVDGAHEIISTINDLRSRGQFDLVVYTQDWHPPDHISFARSHPGKEPFEEIKVPSMSADPKGNSSGAAISQMLWPVHCVQGTFGAALHPLLQVDPQRDVIVQKGMVRDVDSYSGFFDNEGGRSTGLAKLLWKESIERVAIVGLALDYCVLATTMDAHALGFKTALVRDATRAVTVEGGRRALECLQKYDIPVLDAADLYR